MTEKVSKPKDHPETKVKNLKCGTCQWFMSGYNNNNCKTTRGVEVDSNACIEYVTILEDPFHEIASDKFDKGIRAEFLSGKFKIDSESLIEELKRYILDDSYLNNRFGTSQDIESIDRALRVIVSYRSRVSNIYTILIDLKYDHDELINQANLWVFSKYQMIRELKNEISRKMALDRILPESVPLSKTLDKLMVTSKHIDEKLTQNEFTLRAILSSSEKLWFSKNK